MHAALIVPSPATGACLRMIAVAAIWASTYSVGRHATALVLLGWAGVLLLGERLHWSMPVGGALAVLGVPLVSRAGAASGTSEARPASLRAFTTR